MASNQKAIEFSKAANHAATSAMISVQAQGLILECLIGTLLDSGVLSKGAVENLFFMAAGITDESNPVSDSEKEAAKTVRGIIERVAAASGVKIPPPGQTGILRKH